MGAEFEKSSFFKEREKLEESNLQLNKQKEVFFSDIEDEGIKNSVKDFFSKINEQKKSYFEDNKEGINQFEEDKNNFLFENSDFDEEYFETILVSIKEKRLLICELEKSDKSDNLEDRDFVDEKVNSAYENFMDNVDNKNYDKLLALPRSVRIMLCTKARIDMERLNFGDVTSLVFDFKFGGDVINQDIYFNTTAGQLLPAGVQSVLKDGVEYFRSGQLGEFFTENNKRLTIHQGTHITVSNLQSKDEIFKNTNIARVEAGLNEISDTNGKEILPENEELTLEQSIKLEAKLRGIDSEFALIAFKETLEEISEKKRKYVLENMLTEFDRQRGYLRNSGELNLELKYDDVLALRIFNIYGGKKWGEKAKDYGINDKDINNYKDINTSIDLNEFNGAAAKIIGFALRLEKNKDILGAKNCTDWVDKVFIKTTGKRVYDNRTLFDGVKKSSSGTGLGVKEYASNETIREIKGGDHLILDKPSNGKYGVGKTHSVIALGKPKDGIVKVISYPNGKKPPKIEFYDLHGKGRVKKNGKPIRIQRADGEGLASYPKPTNKFNYDVKDNLHSSEREKILSKAPKYVKNLVRKYFPVEEFENALLVCFGESSYDKNAINKNTDSHSSVDRGLFQINDHWHSDKYKGENIFDVEVNVRIASEIFKKAGNSWKPWHAATKIGLI